MELVSMIFSFLKLRTLKTDRNGFVDTLQVVKSMFIKICQYNYKASEGCLCVAVYRNRNAFLIQLPYEYPA
jgi:hypothetical protein